VGGDLHERLLPGAHVVLLTSDELLAVEGRRLGFELRDTILLLWPRTASYAFIFRRPLTEDTLADQVAFSGTGPLNIEACRIQGGIKQATAGRRTIRWGVGQGGCTYEKGTGAIFTTEGRWPCNIALIHGPRCQRVGERRIEGHKGYPNGPGGSSSQFSQKGVATTRKAAWAGHADAEGKETITVWDCQPDCPAALLDRQSGDLPAGVAVRHRSGGKNFGGEALKPQMGDMGYGDSGGAARFYPQFATPWEVLGCSAR
jgi:hypothetical protein